MSSIEIIEADRDEEAMDAHCATLCSCSVGDACPLGKRGMAPRCTADELRYGFLKYKLDLADRVDKIVDNVQGIMEL